MRLLLIIALALLVFATASSAHQPGSDGGGGSKACGVLTGVSKFGPVGVGATKVRCRVARRVARRSVRNKRTRGWRCTGRGTRFGHCHGKGRRRGKSVHWNAYH